MGLGLSIFFVTQSIRFIPRGIRLNASDWFVFKTSSAKELSILFEEVCSSIMGEEEFMRKFEFYTHMPFGYAHIDTIKRVITDTY